MFQQRRVNLGPEVFGTIQLYGNFLFCRFGLTHLDGALQHPLDFLPVQEYLPAFRILFDPRQGEQIVDDLIEAVSLFGNDL